MKLVKFALYCTLKCWKIGNYLLLTWRIEYSIDPDNSTPPTPPPLSLTLTVFRFPSEFELPGFYATVHGILGELYLQEETEICLYPETAKVILKVYEEESMWET